MQVRMLTAAEWTVATEVFQGSLPMRQRIVLTDLASLFHTRAFTIPISVLTPLHGGAVLGSMAEGAITGQIPGVRQLSDVFINVMGLGVPAPLGMTMPFNPGFAINVRSTQFNNPPNRLLVHELTHVWQGTNGFYSTAYVLNSVRYQARSFVSQGDHHGAYEYEPGWPFATYNAEQQASIVEDWYVSGHAGKRRALALYPGLYPSG